MVNTECIEIEIWKNSVLFFQDTDDVLGHFDGKCIVKRINENYKEPKFPTKLTWYPVMRKGQLAGEVLCCFELLELGADTDYPELPAPIQKAGQEMIVPLPDYIKPKEETYDIEVCERPSRLCPLNPTTLVVVPFS